MHSVASSAIVLKLF